MEEPAGLKPGAKRAELLVLELSGLCMLGFNCSKAELSSTCGILWHCHAVMSLSSPPVIKVTSPSLISRSSLGWEESLNPLKFFLVRSRPHLPEPSADDEEYLWLCRNSSSRSILTAVPCSVHCFPRCRFAFCNYFCSFPPTVLLGFNGIKRYNLCSTYFSN